MTDSEVDELAFIILSKTKGWWVVHRDSHLSSSTSSSPSSKKSAWVPAGCLLETSVPPLSLSPEPLTSSSSINASSIPILPSYVVSVSTPGIALMDYSPRNGSTGAGGGGSTGELEVKKGAQLRILKRYNHWSYAIKEDGGRGWVPSWFVSLSLSLSPLSLLRISKVLTLVVSRSRFCGRASKDGTPTTPTTANSDQRPQTAPSNQPTSSTSSTSKPNISIALPSPGVGAGGGAKSAGPVMSGGVGNGGGGNEVEE